MSHLTSHCCSFPTPPSSSLHSNNVEQVISQWGQYPQDFCTLWLLFMESTPLPSLRGRPFRENLFCLPQRDIRTCINLSFFEVPLLKQYTLIFYFCFLHIPLLGCFLKLEQGFAYSTPGIELTTK